MKRGARAFYILGPCKVKKTKRDAETGEESERVVVVGFRGIPVFRLEDTEGAPVEYADYSPPALPPLHEVAERFSVPARYLPNGRAERGHYTLTRG